jgi:hypothetical protein
VVKLLQSADAKEQAWGAWIAGRDQLRELIPAIQAVVAQHAPVASSSNATLDIALDSLIQLQATLPADVLSSVFPERPAQALILASRAGDESNEFLLDVVRHSDGTRWFAAANILLDRSKADLTLAVLEHLKVVISVHIVNAGAGFGVGTGRGGGVGCGAVGLAPGLPPWAAYSLTPYPHPGVVVLATGPEPIYYRRTLSRPGETPATSETIMGGPSSADRLAYVAKAAGIVEATLPIRGDETHSIELNTDAALPVTLNRIRADVRGRLNQLMQLLSAAKLLTERDAAAQQPPVVLEVLDRRSERQLQPNP